MNAIVGDRLASSAIRSSFVEMLVEPDVSVIVPSFGSSFRCRPLLRRLPWVGSPTSQLVSRHSDFPFPRLAHAMRFARRFRVSTDTGSPKFLGDPRHACPGLRSRRSLPEQASGASPLRLALSVLSSEPSDSSTSTTEPYFGIRFRGPRARCLRFVSVVTFRSSKTRFRLATLPCRAGIQPAGSLTWFLSVLAYMTHLQDEACLAHGEDGDWGGG